MTERICLITGTTNGIGAVTARRLAEMGYSVVMGCRDPQRGERLAREIEQRTGNGRIEVLDCDLASLASVRRAAEAFGDRHGRLDVLVNNAGIMTTRYRESPDGIELSFATNYVGPFLLTLLLLERLLQPAPEPADRRIVNVASAVHSRARLPLVPATAAGFSGMQAYAQSKLGNIMFTLTLAERLNGSGVTVNCLHPGVVATNITGSANPLLRFGARLAAPFMLDAERGAATSIYLATDPALDGISGGYFDEHQQQVAPAPAALDRGARETLWNWSVTFCGVSDIASRLDRHQDAGGDEP